MKVAYIPDFGYEQPIAGIERPSLTPWQLIADGISDYPHYELSSKMLAKVKVQNKEPPSKTDKRSGSIKKRKSRVQNNSSFTICNKITLKKSNNDLPTNVNILSSSHLKMIEIK